MLPSVLLHVLAVLLLILITPTRVDVMRIEDKQRILRNRILLQPLPVPSKGGGGGANSTLPASRGRLPRFALRQFTPPVVAPVNSEPRLAMEPTIVAEVTFASLPDSPLGLPDGLPGPPSGGPGTRGGIGGGTDGGVGDRSGAGMDGRSVERFRPGMRPPVVLLQTEPEYSEQARKARIQGTVVLEGVIDERGLTSALRIRDGLGFGLDERAMEAVRHWRFRPATRDGKPVAIVGIFEVNFRLL